MLHTFTELVLFKWYVTYDTCSKMLSYRLIVLSTIPVAHAGRLDVGYAVWGTDIKLAVTQSIANPLLYMRISALRATCCFIPSLPHFTTWLDRTETFSFILSSLPSKSSALSSEGARLSVGMFWAYSHNYGTSLVACWTGGENKSIFIELQHTHSDSYPYMQHHNTCYKNTDEVTSSGMKFICPTTFHDLVHRNG